MTIQKDNLNLTRNRIPLKKKKDSTLQGKTSSLEKTGARTDGPPFRFKNTMANSSPNNQPNLNTAQGRKEEQQKLCYHSTFFLKGLG